MGIIEGAIPRNAVRQAVVAGAAAGNVTVTGIKARDQLVSVLHVVGAGGEAVTDVDDLTSEFTITAAETINNTGGTSTASAKIVVTWLSVG